MPFLAPALPFLLKAAPFAAKALGGLGKGRAQGRAAEADQLQTQDRLRLAAQGQALDAAAFNRGAPGARASTAVRGDVLSRAQPFTLSGEGRNLSGAGGLSPALFSSGTRDLGSAMTREAVLSGLAAGRPGSGGPGTYGRGTNATVPDIYSFNQTFAPTPLPQSGKLDKLLLGAGIASPFLKLLGGKDEDEEDIY